MLSVYGFVYARNPGRGGFLDSVDLAIHETGHLVFAPLGELMGFLGGTLFQLLVPLTFAVYFTLRGERFSAAIPVWWAAQNLLGISVYVRDARAQLLPLVGGGEHDWTYLLTRWGVLERDQGIGNLIHFAGVILMVGALLAALNWVGDERPSAPPVDQSPTVPPDDDRLRPGKGTL